MGLLGFRTCRLWAFWSFGFRVFMSMVSCGFRVCTFQLSGCRLLLQCGRFVLAVRKTRELTVVTHKSRLDPEMKAYWPTQGRWMYSTIRTVRTARWFADAIRGVSEKRTRGTTGNESCVCMKDIGVLPIACRMLTTYIWYKILYNTALIVTFYNIFLFGWFGPLLCWGWACDFLWRCPESWTSMSLQSWGLFGDCNFIFRDCLLGQPGSCPLARQGRICLSSCFFNLVRLFQMQTKFEPFSFSGPRLQKLSTFSGLLQTQKTYRINSA